MWRGIRYFRYNPRKLLINATSHNLGIYNWLTSETQLLDTRVYEICEIWRADLSYKEDKIVFSVSKGGIL